MKSRSLLISFSIESLCVLRLSGSLRYAKDEVHERNWSFKFWKRRAPVGGQGRDHAGYNRMHVINIPASVVEGYCW
jgi:hypothetical protein